MRKQRNNKLLAGLASAFPGATRGVHEWLSFSQFLGFYLKKKTLRFSNSFEKQKNLLVKLFIIKRGRYNRPFLHIATMGVLFIGVLIGPYLADTYPVFSSPTFKLPQINSASAQESIEVDSNVFQTQESAKPRSGIIDYTVERGDTLSTIAEKFGISQDTIKWENDMTTDDVTVGDDLKILPVTGIAYKVQSGDTVYTIAKKFATNAQHIVDWPFNDFANPETFSLITGEILIVPDGVQPDAQPAYLAQKNSQVISGPVPSLGGGWYSPLSGEITTYFSGWHPGIDIAGPDGTPIVAMHSGTVERVSVGTFDTGYGNNVWVDDENGTSWHTAHMDEVYVSVGQQVIGGKTVIGTRGNTGRSTGPHTHTEIQLNGIYVNPLGYINP